MDDKEMTPFARGLLILCEGYWEERGHTLIGAKVVTSDSDSRGGASSDAKTRTA